jgi:hypothetical protein
MSTIIEFSDSDLLRNRIIPPGWYVLDIQGHRTWSPSKAGDSDNMFFECVVEKNADNGDTDFAGVPIELMFNSKPKAKGFMEGFLRGMGVNVESKTRYDMESAVGKKIEAFIENDTYNGRLVNKVNHKYRVAKS